MSVPEKHRAIAHAWVDGAAIEVKAQHSDQWFKWDAPDFSGCDIYRIKPKPKVKKWWWACMDGVGHYFATGPYTEDEIRINYRHPVQKIDGSEIEV